MGCEKFSPSARIPGSARRPRKLGKTSKLFFFQVAISSAFGLQDHHVSKSSITLRYPPQIMPISVMSSHLVSKL
jgi:hypothetical protein